VRMSASASLLTGKNRRRALLALIAAPLVALGSVAGSGTAYAAPPPVFRPAEVQLGGGHCSVSGWPNGEIFCGSSIGANFPNGTQEVFGIGLDEAVWTDWGTEASPSGWKSLGAPPNTRCNPAGGTVLSNNGDYGLVIACLGMDGNVWIRVRADGVNGGWAPWEVD
jgi:hypothetical protein